MFSSRFALSTNPRFGHKLKAEKLVPILLLTLFVGTLLSGCTTSETTVDTLKSFEERSIIFIRLSERVHSRIRNAIDEAKTKFWQSLPERQKNPIPSPVMISNVAISNSSGRKKVFQENFTAAFKQMMSSSGGPSTLKTQLDNETVLVQINPRFAIQAVEKPNESGKRAIHIAVENVYEVSYKSEIVGAGVDHFIHTEYVSQENEEWLMNDLAELETSSEKGGFWGDVLIPLTVSSAVGIIVYLFFAVRTN